MAGIGVCLEGLGEVGAGKDYFSCHDPFGHLESDFLLGAKFPFALIGC